MKKALSIILSVIIAASVFTTLPLSSSAAAKKKASPKVSLKKTSATLKISKKKGKNVYGSTTIKVKKAKGVTIKKKSFKSSNKKIAKVSSKGKVVAKKKGSAKITVTVKYKYKKKTCTKKLYFKVKVKDTRKKTVTPTKPTEPAKPAEPASSDEQPSESEAASSEVMTSEASASESSASETSETSASETSETSAPETSESSSPESSESIPKETENLDDPLNELNNNTKALNSVKAPTGSTYYFSDSAMLTKLSEFSNKLYEMSSKDKTDNYSMSPVSVYMALSMLYSIGDDGVKSDINQLTKMTDADIKKTAELFNYLSKEYKNFDGETVSTLNLTNSIWLNNGTKTNQDTLDSLADDFYCSAYETPFSANNQQANKDIRDFIKKNTNGLIDQDFGLSEETLFALINTLYFKDAWCDQDLSTKQMAFNLKNGSVTTEFLIGKYSDGQVQETNCCRYFFAETSCGYKIKFVVPKTGYTLKQAMASDNLNKVMQDKDYNAFENEVNHHTRCIFPKFNVTSDTPLKTIFEENNLLTNAFAAYTSPLINNTALCVSDIKHKTVLKVDKKGIEGAAVTIIANEATAMPPEYEKYHDFVIDSEFGFVITNNRDDVVLFEGQVTDPSK